MAETGDRRSTVRQTNALVRELVEQETVNYPFWLGGIVSRSYVSDLGHQYFDLSDADHTIACMVRETVRGTIPFPISNGIEVEVYGTVRVYEKNARVQIEVEQARLIEHTHAPIDPDLIKQLEAKGLWPRRKRNLPPNIQQIGLITSKQSEALHDFEDHYRHEGGTARITVRDVRLQGEGSVKDIVVAVERLNREKQVDVIVLTRGGGRGVDLALFDDPQIVEAICRSQIPIVTGIGHQRDDTLADQVADYSAITPTAAASYLARQGRPQRVSEPAASANESPRRPHWSLYLALLFFLLGVAALVVTLVWLNSPA